MHVHVYEKFWMALSVAMLVGFLGALFFGFSAHSIEPPSHIETIDPATVTSSSEFAQPGVWRRDDGGYEIVMVTEMFRFLPSTMTVEAGVPVRFRAASPDVLHGLQIVGTNVNTMVAPGYVSDFTVTFPAPGEYLVVCNEYCGLSHHLMQGRLIVLPAGSAQAEDPR